MRVPRFPLLAVVLAVLVTPPEGSCDETAAYVNRTQAWFYLDPRDSDGLKRDTWYFLGYQWVTIGILYAAPEGVSGWSEEQKEGYSMSIWWDNVTHPQIDSDDFYINYILHPYWGASYYVRARERGYDDAQAFWYSVLLSSVYEFGAEALFEEPSIQDIFVTPIFGSLLGKYFMDVRSNIRDRDVEYGYRSRRDRWVWALTDPLGTLNEQFDKLTGREGSLQVRPFRFAPRYGHGRPFALSGQDADTVYGLELRYEW